MIPARGGDVVRLFLTKTSVPNSSYPAVAATFFVELIYDVAMGSLILLFAFTQGVFPKPPDFAKLNAFDLSYLAQHPRFALFLITALAIGVLAAFALLSVRVRAFWDRVQAGLHDPEATATATCARCSRCSSRAGCSGSPPSGRCSRRSTWAGASRTCCSCWA